MTGSNRRVLVSIILVLALALAWYSRRVLLLAFSGLLLSLVFTSLVNQLRRFIPLKQGLGVALVLALMLGIAVAIGFLLAPGLTSEFSDLADRLPRTVHDLMAEAQSKPMYQRISRSLPQMNDLASSSGSFLSRLTSVFSSTFETLAGLILLVFVALFLAASPGVYRNFALTLIPPSHRGDAEQILGRIICTLKYWLLGQFVSMCIIGVMVGVSFALCGLPLAASLGILAGIGEFIPFVGPFIAAFPALLLALDQSGKLFLIVLGVYLAIQFAEGHFVMPLVQRQTVNLPPVLTLLAVFFMGNAFGLLGMFVAAPLTAVALVLIEEVYLRRWLRDSRQLIQRE